MKHAYIILYYQITPLPKIFSILLLRNMQDIEEGPSSTRSASRLPGSLQRFLSQVGVVNTRNPFEESQHGLERADDQHSAPSSPSIFESSLDLTPERLRYVFERFDTDEDGKISYESLRKGLDFAGQSNTVSDEASFQKLIEYLDMDRSGDITYEEFCEGLRLLMLRDLLKRTKHVDLKDALIEVMDYDTVNFERHVVQYGEAADAEAARNIDAKDFFFEDRADWVQTRWVHVSGINSAFIMQQISVKYALHPLALEDALSPDSHRPKAEHYTGHYFIMCPYFSIIWEPFVMESRPKKWTRMVPQCVRRCFDCLPGCSERRQHSSREVAPKKRISSIHAHMASMFVKTPANDTMITYVYGDSVEENVWLRVQQDLELSYSKLRQYDAQYLVYALLDEAVDAIEPVIAKVRAEIEEERERLRTAHFDSLDRIHHLKSELNKVSQKLKPFMRLLTHVIEDDAISPGATIYLRDVLDNLEGNDEEVRQLLITCESVDDDADKFQARQMDQTLYTLTVISAVFLPAQFLSGVFGMNFTDMPELEQPWGYEMFWAVSIFMMVSVFVWLNFGRIR